MSTGAGEGLQGDWVVGRVCPSWGRFYVVCGKMEQAGGGGGRPRPQTPDSLGGAGALGTVGRGTGPYCVLLQSWMPQALREDAPHRLSSGIHRAHGDPSGPRPHL